MGVNRNDLISCNSQHVQQHYNKKPLESCKYLPCQPRALKKAIVDLDRPSGSSSSSSLPSSVVALWWLMDTIHWRNQHAPASSLHSCAILGLIYFFIYFCLYLIFCFFFLVFFLFPILCHLYLSSVNFKTHFSMSNNYFLRSCHAIVILQVVVEQQSQWVHSTLPATSGVTFNFP